MFYLDPAFSVCLLLFDLHPRHRTYPFPWTHKSIRYYCSGVIHISMHSVFFILTYMHYAHLWHTITYAICINCIQVLTLYQGKCFSLAVTFVEQFTHISLDSYLVWPLYFTGYLTVEIQCKQGVCFSLCVGLSDSHGNPPHPTPFWHWIGATDNSVYTTALIDFLFSLLLV